MSAQTNSGGHGVRVCSEAGLHIVSIDDPEAECSVIGLILV